MTLAPASVAGCTSAYAAQLALDPGILTAVVDLVLWLLVLWFGTSAREGSRVP